MRSAAWVFGLLILSCSDPNAEPGGGQSGAPAGGGGSGGQASGGSSTGGTAAAGAASMAGSAGSAAGSAGSAAGSAGSAAGGASCEARWAEYEPLALSARKCDPNAATPECKFDVVVLDACGCSIPANGSSPDYAKARRLLPSYAEDCDFPKQCFDCQATLDAACMDDGTGVSRCVYR